MKEMKTCAKCGETKPATREMWRALSGEAGAWCEECHAAAAPARYHCDPHDARALGYAARRARAARLREFTRDHYALSREQKHRLARECQQQGRSGADDGDSA